MQFTIDAFVFDVTKRTRRPIDADGRSCDGRIDFDAASIALWTGLTGQRLLNTLLHELRHAWCWARPIGLDAPEEIAVQDAANFAQAMLAQLQAQGGLPALDTMPAADASPVIESPVLVPIDRAEPVFEPLDAVGELSADRWRAFHVRDKPCCGGWVYSRRLWTGKPYWLDSFRGRPVGGRVVDRACYCSECRVLSKWVEAIDPFTGEPCGPIDEAEQLTRKTHEHEVSRWLVDHPECVDVIAESAA